MLTPVFQPGRLQFDASGVRTQPLGRLKDYAQHLLDLLVASVQQFLETMSPVVFSGNYIGDPISPQMDGERC